MIIIVKIYLMIRLLAMSCGQTRVFRYWKPGMGKHVRIHIEHKYVTVVVQVVDA